MFSTIQRPSSSLTCRTLSWLPSPMSTNGSSSAPICTAVGTSLVIVMTSTVSPLQSPGPVRMLCRTMGTSTVDIFNPDTYVDGPPHEAFAELRRTDPVHWQEMGGDPRG